jgi:hypothetical protein
MSSRPRYSLDSSALINGWHKLYPSDTFHGLWDDLLPGLIRAGTLVATKEVLREVEKQDDAVLAWCIEHNKLFVEIDDAQQAKMSYIINKHVRLVDSKKNRSACDPWVIALAMCHDPALTVITEEGSGGKSPRIPDVCGVEGLQCLNLLGLIQREKWSFKSK